MEDAYYLEKSLKDTGSVISIPIDQLKDTPAYLMSLLLEIVSAAVNEYQKQGIIISKTALSF